MGLFPAMSKIIRKGKCLFLLLLCLCVVAWIATLSNDDTVKPVQEGSNPSEDKSVEGFAKLELESEMMHSIEERVEEQSAKESCPEHSPLLRECCLIRFFFFFLWVDPNEMLCLKYRLRSKLSFVDMFILYILRNKGRKAVTGKLSFQKVHFCTSMNYRNSSLYQNIP